MLLLAAGAAAPVRDVRPEIDVAEAGHLLGLDAIVAQIREGTSPPGAREDVARRVLGASFEVDSAIADIQEEQTQLAELISALQDSRDARVSVLNAAAGIFAVGAAVGTGMTLNDNTTTAGIWVTTITSGIGAALTIYAALAPNRGMPPLRTQNNMLAPFFGCPIVSGYYPRVVWQYLTSVPPGGTVSRKARLLDQWSKLGRLPEEPSPEREDRIRALCRPVQDRVEVSADLLRDRNLMLGDVRAEVASMKLGLRSLLEAVEPAAPNG